MTDRSGGRRASDPISELRSFLRAATAWKFGDPTLEDELAALQSDVRAKQRRDPDWDEVYRHALAVAERVLATQQSASAKTPGAVGAPVDPRLHEQMIGSAKRAISQTQSAWSGRLSSQVKNDFMPKVDRSIEGLSVIPTKDPGTGTTNYQIDPEQLAQFYEWLAGLERNWAKHNGELAATRANEAIAKVLGGFRLDFAVESARINPPPTPVPGRPKLEGHTIDTPGPFALLGSTYRLVMSSVGGVSAIGFLAARFGTVGQSVRTIVPPLMGVVLIVTIVVVAVTVPRQRRQGLTRVARDAQKKVQAELQQTIARRLHDFEASQMNDIRRHLSDEEMRLSALTHAARLSASDASAPHEAPRISSRDIDDLRTRWIPAMEARLAEGTGS